MCAEAMKEVYISKQGEDVILSARQVDWSGFFVAADRVDADFGRNVESVSTREYALD